MVADVAGESSEVNLVMNTSEDTEIYTFRVELKIKAANPSEISEAPTGLHGVT
jgi:hypothetical protein